MGTKRLALLGVAAAVGTGAFGATQAWAPHPVFTDPPHAFLRFGAATVTGVGFDLGVKANAHPPVGSRVTVTVLLLNSGSAHYGKPGGGQVGRVLIDCAVVARGRAGRCSGLAKLPDGFFTFTVPDGAVAFSGSAPFAHARLRNDKAYEILGGVGAYAGEVGTFVVNSPADVRVIL